MQPGATIILTPKDCENIEQFNRFVLAHVKSHSPRTALFIKLVNGRVASLISIRGEGVPFQENGHRFIPAEEYSAAPHHWLAVRRKDTP